MTNYPSKIRIFLNSINYDAIYSIENKPQIIFKEFDITQDNIQDIEDEIYSLHKQVWNFGEVPILFIVLPNEIRIYNGFIFNRDKEKNEIWKKITEKNKDDIYEFKFMNLVSGALWKKYEAIFSKKERVQDYLLKNLKDARKVLHKKGLPFSIIHSIIGRLIFSRYLIDRGVLDRDFFHKKYGCDFEEIILDKENLYDFFGYLRTEFNGDLFPLIDGEKNKINNSHLKTLCNLFKGYNIGTGQTVLFDIYDFSIIPVELISNIYETFLKRESKNSNKPYYTPLFLVDYVLNHTLDEMLEKISSSNCKVLDPACGSGIFLVKSLRRLIDKEMEIKGYKLENRDLERIVLDNIFGIDKDEDAIHLSIFSIYLTLLDYQESKDIKKFTFPELKNRNLFVSDFFDLRNDFNSKIEDIDLVVGNPPWGQVGGPHIHYCEKNSIPISYKQIAQSFLIRVKDFASSNAKIALIVTSKILYNITSERFREYFLKNFVVDRVLEFSSVRRNVFENAIGPGAIIFYRFVHDQDTRNNVIEHISLKPNRFFELFQAIIIEKHDVKHIQQRYFMDNDWLWKVILYGNILDFHFIKRLKNNYKSIKELIDESKGQLKKGVGVQRPSKGKPPKFTTLLVNRPYLDTKKDILQRYFTDIQNASKWRIEYLHRPRDEKLFEPPYILMDKWLNTDFQSVAAFSDQEWAFTDAVTAIKGRPRDVDTLKNFLGLLNSQLFTYYIFLIGSSTGIEREQVHNPKRLSFPVILDDRISRKVDQLQQMHKNINENEDISEEYREVVSKIENELDEIIFSLYEIDTVEKDLIDYTFDVSIPLFKGKEELFNPPTEKQLKEYAQIFLNHFERRMNGPNEFFCIEIYNVDYFVAMNFKIVRRKPQRFIDFIQDDDIDRIIRSLGDISIEKMKNMYIQRDIKGFETTSFYVIKPNEYKNWHRTIARLDLSEFIDAMIKADLERIEMEVQQCL